MKTLKTIGLALLVLVALLGLGGFLLPRHVYVERKAFIDAPATALQAQIADLRNWERWSPWHKLDPKMQITYSTPSAGQGAWYSWTSDNDQVGNGKLALTAVTPDSIGTTMDFGMETPAYSAFHFTPQDGGTVVRWTLHTDMGANPYVRYMGLFMDQMVGTDYEKGLANLAQATMAE